MAAFIENVEMHNRNRVFADRTEAGIQLAEMLGRSAGPYDMVLAIPAGGVPVGIEIARGLDLDFDLVLVRKVQIPWNTEAGFGAVNMDADLFLNEHLLSLLHLSAEQINRQVGTTMATIEQRNRKFRENKPFPDISGKHLILADDGLASGYTMRAAIAYLKKRKPGSITLALPTGSADTVQVLLKEADAIFCLNIRDSYPYAVASAYRNWYDLEDEDVLQLISTFKSSRSSRIK